MTRAWTVARSNHQKPNGRKTLATPKTRPQKTGVLTRRARLDGVVDASCTTLRTVRCLRVHVAIRVLGECSCTLERAEVPRMSVPWEVRGRGVGINEHPAYGIEHL